MKQIMLAGQFNTTTRNLKKFLGKEYQVQLAPDDTEIVSGMLKMDIPDLILISTSGMEKQHKEIFSYIKENYPNVPVVYVGTGEELKLFKDFEETEQFTKIERPVQVKTILRTISQILTGDVEYEEVEERAPWERKRVFIIDDSTIQRNMLKSLLREQYDIDDAASGREALRKMRTWMPDLILLDYDMPEQDGKEVFERLQKEERYRDIPVVFLTGVKEKEKIQAVLGLLPAGYLLKPVEQARLMELLEELVGA